jgi:DNA-binding HxlR family transcriptional regulator
MGILLFLGDDTKLRNPREEGTFVFPNHSDVTTQDPGSHTECVVVREILDRVGDKWSVLVISLLGERGHRFNELRHAIDGISQRMLTLTLRQLERDGLVERAVHATVPPRVDYALTDLGESVLEPIMALTRWAAEHGTDIAEARRKYEDAQRDALL